MTERTTIQLQRYDGSFANIIGSNCLPTTEIKRIESGFSFFWRCPTITRVLVLKVNYDDEGVRQLDTLVKTIHRDDIMKVGQ